MPKVVVVMLNGALTVKVNVWFALFCGVLLSVTVTANVYEPTVVGVPLIVPVAGDRLNPVGKLDPATNAQVRGAAPLTAVKVAEYETDCVAAGKLEFVVIDNAVAAFTVKVNFCETLCCGLLLSVTVMTKE